MSYDPIRTTRTVPFGISSTVATVKNSSVTKPPFAPDGGRPRTPGKDSPVLRDYRDWLESELKLLGNASHHAYSFGQANMAKRALERLDAELAGRVDLLLDTGAAAELLAFLESKSTEGPL